MEGQPPIVQQPTNAVESQPGNPNVQQPMNGQPGYPPPGAPGPPVFIPMAPIPGVPIGLEPLIPLDHILVRQMIEPLEIVTGFETANRYNVLNGIGQRIFFAVEKTDCCERFCCGKNRNFTIDIIDFFGRTVMSMHRIFHCCRGDDMTVSLGDGSILGEVTHVCHCCEAQFVAKNAKGEPVMEIKGPCIPECCTCDAEYPVTTMNGEKMGVIRKSFSGLLQEMFTDADNFGVEFSPYLDVPTKALMFAAVFLIDFIYFEKK